MEVIERLINRLDDGVFGYLSGRKDHDYLEIPFGTFKAILTEELAFIKEVEGVLEKGDASMYQHKDAVAKALKLIRNVDTCEQIPTKGE